MYRNVSIRPISQSDHQSRTKESICFVTRVISKIPELSHGIQDRRPRHSKHPSLLAMPAVFPAFSITLVGRFPELTPVRSQATSRGFLPWIPVTSLVPSHPPCMPGSETGAPSPRLVGRFVLVAMRPCIHRCRSHHHPDTCTPMSTLGVGLGHNGMLFFFCFGLCALPVRMAATRRTATCRIPSAA